MSPENEDVVHDDSQDEVDDVDQDTTKSQKAVAKRRTKTGCLTCRKRRIKCGEERPTCRNCIKSKRECAGYNPPLVYKRGQDGPVSFPNYDTGYLNGYARYPVDHQAYEARQYAGPRYDHSTFQTQLRTENTTPALDQGYSSHPVHHEMQAGQAFVQNQWQPFTARQNITSDPAFFASEPPLLEPRRQSTTFSEQSINTMPNTPYTASLVSGPYSGVASSITSASPNVLQYPEPQVPIYSEHGFIERSTFVRTNSVKEEYPFAAEMVEDDPNDPYDVMDELQDSLPGASESDQTQEMYNQQLSSVTRNTFQNSPLMNSKCQRIFQHFIIITGPNMSIFDHLEYVGPHDPPKMVWTQELPAMALSYPALAHAILAISAMQLARLGQGSQDTALKHFTLALRRAGKLLASDESRHHVSTLATVLLLAYYEVIVGDHSRWSLHLSGAARLVMEHNYASTFRTIRRMRKGAKANLQRYWDQKKHNLSDRDYVRVADIPEALLDNTCWEVDQVLVGKLMGVEIDYDSQTQSNIREESELADLSKSEVHDLKILMEMYWWYIKQDVFQSMLSGDAPMLPYSKMKYCPPRGQIGRADCAHATMDHLWLIMARLVTFGAKDRARKLRVVASQGGEWIPAPGFLQMPPMPPNMPRTGVRIQKPESQTQPPHNLQDSRDITPPTANEGRTRKVKHPPFAVPGAAQPPMYGMIPPPAGPVHMSTSFNAMHAELQKDAGDTPESAHSSDTPNSELDLKKALAEHGSITVALDLFKDSLSVDFHPLPGGERLTTPFGPPLRYKSPTIASIWTFYHVCRILLRRLHPHSPPAAMVSAGVNAYATRENAQSIGKIIGGLYAQHTILVDAGHMDYMFTAALMETTFPLLFAAVQYQDPAQRGWTVAKLGDIARSTGWASSSAVAAACETTWERMGMAGKGPPYTRTLDRQNSDKRVSGRAHNTQTTSKVLPQMDAIAEHESRFVSHDRELINRHGSTRAYWALGLLSVEEDLEKMELGRGEGHDGEN